MSAGQQAMTRAANTMWLVILGEEQGGAGEGREGKGGEGGREGGRMAAMRTPEAGPVLWQGAQYCSTASGRSHPIVKTIQSFMLCHPQQHNHCFPIQSNHDVYTIYLVSIYPISMLLDILSKCPRYFSHGPAALMWSVVHLPFTYRNSLVNKNNTSFTSECDLDQERHVSQILTIPFIKGRQQSKPLATQENVKQPFQPETKHPKTHLEGSTSTDTPLLSVGGA